MGLTQTKLHFKILREKWPGVVERVSTPKGRSEARTQNPLGDLPLHYACYTGRAPAYAIRALLAAYPEGAGVRNGGGFLPLEVAEVNYRRESPHRAEAMEALRSATDAANALAALSPEEAEKIRAGGMPDEVYRTSKTCVVCLDGAATMVVAPCGHLCLCEECSAQVRERRVCPVGRCFVGNIIPASTAVATGSSDGSCGGEPFADDGGVDEPPVLGVAPTGPGAAVVAVIPAC